MQILVIRLLDDNNDTMQKTDLIFLKHLLIFPRGEKEAGYISIS